MSSERWSVILRLANASFPRSRYADVSLIVRHHHERIDGEGYPDKIKAEDIPLISRIIAVADAYNAMTSDRPYRAAMGYTVARDRLLQAMGSQFFTDPVVTFLSILAEADDDYRELGDAALVQSLSQVHPRMDSPQPAPHSVRGLN